MTRRERIAVWVCLRCLEIMKFVIAWSEKGARS